MAVDVYDLTGNMTSEIEGDKADHVGHFVCSQFRHGQRRGAPHARTTCCDKNALAVQFDFPV